MYIIHIRFLIKIDLSSSHNIITEDNQSINDKFSFNFLCGKVYKIDVHVSLKAPPPTQKSIFAQERPNGLKFSGYVGPKADSL